MCVCDVWSHNAVVAVVVDFEEMLCVCVCWQAPPGILAVDGERVPYGKILVIFVHYTETVKSASRSNECGY